MFVGEEPLKHCKKMGQILVEEKQLRNIEMVVRATICLPTAMFFVFVLYVPS